MFHCVLAVSNNQLNKLLLWQVLFVSFLSLCFWSFAANANDETGVSTESLDALRENGAILVDIRSPAEIAKTGIIQGSEVMPFFDDQGYTNGIAWLAAFSEKVNPEQVVVLIGQSGNFPLSVCNMLKQQEGYLHTKLLKGGVNAWLEEGRALNVWSSELDSSAENTVNVTEDFSVVEKSIVVED